MSNTAVLDVRNISFQYEQHAANPLVILDNVSFSLNESQSMAIVGSSGSGKSTLLHVVGGLDVPTSGEVSICQQSLYAPSVSDQRRTFLRSSYLGFVYQFHHLLAEFTTLENVALPLLIQGFSGKKANQEAKILLKEIGLDDRIKHKPAELSGGERQRVAIVRALVNRPKCLLADEPTGNLDQENAHASLNLMKDLIGNRGGALVVVTHDLQLASQLDCVYKLTKGRISDKI